MSTKVAVKSFSPSLCMTVKPFSTDCSWCWNLNAKFRISQRRSSANNNPKQVEVLFLASQDALEVMSVTESLTGR